jgi:hypothetical protein
MAAMGFPVWQVLADARGAFAIEAAPDLDAGDQKRAALWVGPANAKVWSSRSSERNPRRPAKDGWERIPYAVSWRCHDSGACIGTALVFGGFSQN